VDDPERTIGDAVAEVRPPESLGRGRRRIADIDARPEDLELVAALGYPVG
jgi:hypothetical protein